MRAEEGGDDSSQFFDVLRGAGVERVLDERVLGAGRTAEGTLEGGVGTQAGVDLREAVCA
jgi:hypothetical protein